MCKDEDKHPLAVFTEDMTILRGKNKFHMKSQPPTSASPGRSWFSRVASVAKLATNWAKEAKSKKGQQGPRARG
jgi:hypothetical protein